MENLDLANMWLMITVLLLGMMGLQLDRFELIAIAWGIAALMWGGSIYLHRKYGG